jgi:1,4-alpha-glucan branching enzyme
MVAKEVKTGVGTMSVSKKYLKSRPVSKVTFRLRPDAAAEIDQACLVGEFNGWDPQAARMQKLKSGEFKITLDLEVGREYQYRYLLDGSVWANDDGADRYAPSGLPGTENSVVIV